jgi:hypothetical protein
MGAYISWSICTSQPYEGVVALNSFSFAIARMLSVCCLEVVRHKKQVLRHKKQVLILRVKTRAIPPEHLEISLSSAIRKSFELFKAI